MYSLTCDQTIISRNYLARALADRHSLSLSVVQRFVPAHHSLPLTEQDKLLAMCKQDRVLSLEEMFTET